MKTRTGFVSNSSSSSFVIISSSGKTETANTYLHDVVSIRGETQFGWQEKTYDGWMSKANFAKIQTSYFDCPKKELSEHMLDKVIMAHTGAAYIEWGVEDGYIDHQSSAVEGENIEMFESEEVLHNFIFNCDSCIINDNDNH